MDQQLPPIRIFRPGSFVSAEGADVSFTEADLQAAAAAYDPQADPAPIVIGHPAMDDPAWGWVGGLSFADGTLQAQPDKVEPAFAELVRAGRYRKVSARFYPPAHPSNPKPGAWYLKHVGFLGAAAPAVKGLGTVQFSDAGDAGTLTIHIDKETDMKELSFAEQQAALEARAKELDDREAMIAQQQEESRKATATARHTANVSFAEGLVAAATLAPAGKELVVGLLDQLDATAVVSFGEAGEMTPADGLRKLLQSGGKLIDVSERGAKPKDGGGAFASFAAPDGYEVDPTSANLYVRARKIQADNPDLAWMACVSRAQQG